MAEEHCLRRDFLQALAIVQTSNSRGGEGMSVYIDGVIILNFLVDFLLLLGTNRICGHPPSPGKAAMSAVLGGLYGGACLLPGFSFLGNFLWRMVSLGLMSVLAFGWSISALRRGIVFAFLSMALGGIAFGLGGSGFFGIAISAFGVFLLCRLGFSGEIGGRKFIPVELHHDDRRLQLTALQDTGNTLRDPVTGTPVLVVAAEIGEQLTGLTREQLRRPVESVEAVPGLRLIPYHCVGNSGGLLLALRIPKVKIGTWQGSSLVAFAPEGLSSDGEYQALTGGVA